MAIGKWAIRADSVMRKLPHVGTYRRELPVSLERLYENAVDWEHLPYLHRSSFSKIDCDDAGEWGFRARVWGQPFDQQRSFVIELQLDPELRRWITRTVEGPGTGSEIWTHAFTLGDRKTLVVVDFFVPGVSQARAPELGNFYTSLYARLYDEDVSMMTERQTQLDAAKSGALRRDPLELGSLDEIRRSLPLIVESAGRKYRIVEVAGQLVAHSIVCPHRLGPLGDCKVEDATIECPWHGYRFDIRTRECVNGARMSLAPAPRVQVESQGARVILKWE
ncbi:MAG TPA: Rieske (2Fe-2S) protein [Candidatus Binataceae bacterium]|nr:Rieske (2Fe-2S) protein [Candidatus Binataceae bacterium]